MSTDHERPEGDETYFESSAPPRVFDTRLLEEPPSALSTQSPFVLAPTDSVTEAMQGMQRERRGCTLITEDGTLETRLLGIFTERDVLFRIVDHGRNPATLPLRDVMTREPECLPQDSNIAWLLNKMAIGGFRHVPVVDEKQRPICVVSMRDVVAFFVDCFPQDVLNLPPDHDQPELKTREGA